MYGSTETISFIYRSMFLPNSLFSVSWVSSSSGFFSWWDVHETAHQGGIRTRCPTHCIRLAALVGKEQWLYTEPLPYDQPLLTLSQRASSTEWLVQRVSRPKIPRNVFRQSCSPGQACYHRERRNVNWKITSRLMLNQHVNQSVSLWTRVQNTWTSPPMRKRESQHFLTKRTMVSDLDVMIHIPATSDSAANWRS